MHTMQPTHLFPRMSYPHYSNRTGFHNWASRGSGKAAMPAPLSWSVFQPNGTYWGEIREAADGTFEASPAGAGPTDTSTVLWLRQWLGRHVSGSFTLVVKGGLL